MDKKQERKAQLLMRTTMYDSRENVMNRDPIDGSLVYNETLKNQKIIHEFFDKKKCFNEAARKSYWWNLIFEQKKITDVYKLKPVRERKDNKDVLNTGSGWGRNSIRYPKKVRSAGCWKRFYKLFPHLKLEKK